METQMYYFISYTWIAAHSFYYMTQSINDILSRKALGSEIRGGDYILPTFTFGIGEFTAIMAILNYYNYYGV